ncbi:hypothetical protein B7463_g4828, partial [Scytalidium lignicola]
MPKPRIRTVEGSCWGCKERRVICDLNTPTCDKCATAGRHCDYGKVRLRWTDCVASRGRLAGKKIPLYRPPTLQKNRDQYMLYFEAEVLPRFTIANNVLRVDLENLSRDPILLHSVVAVANAHQTYRNTAAPDPSSALSKLKDRNGAIKMFRKNLSDAHNSTEVNNSLFLANVLLCILDGIIEPSTKETPTHHHLLGGKAILSQWGGAQEILSMKHELPVLFLSIFATMDLTHAVLIGDRPFFEPSSWAELSNRDSWWGNVASDDDYLETMAIFAQLANLGHETLHVQSTIPIGTLLSIQMALEQQAYRRADLPDGDNPETASWSAFCSVYRFSASIYLYRALSGLPIGHLLVQQSVSSCVDVIASPTLSLKHHHCILFPLLIVAAHCLLDSQRVVVQKSLAQTASFLSFESLRSLKAFLEQLWTKLDRDPATLELSWWDLFNDIASVTCLF